MLRDERDKWEKSASTAEIWNAKKRPMNSLNDVDKAGMETERQDWTWIKLSTRNLNIKSFLLF